MQEAEKQQKIVFWSKREPLEHSLKICGQQGTQPRLLLKIIVSLFLNKESVTFKR